MRPIATRPVLCDLSLLVFILRMMAFGCHGFQDLKTLYAEDQSCPKTGQFVKLEAEAKIKFSMKLPAGLAFFIRSEDYSSFAKADNVTLYPAASPDAPLGATFTDLFGVRINWTDPDDGWSAERRQFLKEQRKLCVESNFFLPKFTKKGYKKMKIPSKLYDFIMTNWDPSRRLMEPCSPGALNCFRMREIPVFVGHNHNPEVPKVGQRAIGTAALYFFKNQTNLVTWKLPTDQVLAEIHGHMTPILERWIGGEIPLRPTAVYGPRLYYNGSSLQLHVDHIQTHVVSAILQLQQHLDQDWPLTFLNGRTKSQILLKPGEMLLYESARCAHGRQWPMRGHSMANLFVHTQPASTWYAPHQLSNNLPIDHRHIFSLDDLKKPLTLQDSVH